jgi:multiple sugar transport system substrate-binding protein
LAPRAAPRRRQGKETQMIRLTRRTLLRGTVGLAAAGALARPYVADAAAKTATVWWVQGFVPEEDAAFRRLAADYEKESGNKLDYSIVPFAPMRQKIVSALTSGVVPDLMQATPAEIVPLSAWKGQLVDVTDVVETQKSAFLPVGLQSAYCYSNVEKRRSYYAVPFAGAVVPFHVWGSLVEKAGYKTADIPKTWDAFIDFFKPMQDKLRAKGMRHVYSYGWEISSIGVDPINTFNAFMIAYGGQGLVTPDGRLHADDPKVKEAVVKTLTRLWTDFKDGNVPPSALNWNDADDNNAFHSQQVVIDYDGTISTEVAMLKNNPQAYYHEVLTFGLPLDNDGKEMPAQYGINCAMIPKGAKNVEVAKDFMKYTIQPKVSGTYLKGGLGRWLPVMPQIVKDDPWWTDEKDPHRGPYVRQGLFKPIIAFYYVFNPGFAQVRTEHVFNQAWADSVLRGMKPEDAADKALKRIEEIFAKYPIEQA